MIWDAEVQEQLSVVVSWQTSRIATPGALAELLGQLQSALDQIEQLRAKNLAVYRRRQGLDGYALAFPSIENRPSH